MTDVYGQIPIFAFAVFLGFGFRRWKALQENIPFSRILFAGNLLCLAAVFCIAQAAKRWPEWRQFDPDSYAMSVVYVLGTVLLALACLPLKSWKQAIRSSGLLWLYASLAGVAGWLLSTQIRVLWMATSNAQSGAMQSATLYMVRAVLGIFLHNILFDPATFTIGTPQYLICIAKGCSGVEGLGLVLLFTSAWLWHVRKECRFPRALLLIPCALACSWLLNIARLCILILIMNVSNSDSAADGFHVVAGWVSFILIALTFSQATLRLSWMRKPQAQAASADAEERGESPAIRAYLVPFLAILAAAFVSKAVSASFDWLYSLRLIAAAAAIFYFRAELKKLNWRFGWLGPAAGVAVFLLWVAPSWVMHFWWGHPYAASPLGPALAALPPAARWSWIALRVAAAVVTVPIAEELAFRGYLARRLMHREFDEVPFQSLTALSVGLSSVAFGLMHGEHWLVGIVAGLAYAGVLRWRGRMGDAVVAHAVSNLLLAVWVLGLGDWAQW